MFTRVRAIRPFRSLFAWFSHGHRLTALIVITAAVAVAALGYSFLNDRSQSAADKRAAADRAAFYACVPKYVSDLSRTNLPRTIASIEASNARFNWDVGHDKDHPTWGKARLKVEYERLYRKYQAVIVTNPPLPAFSAKYCETKSATRLPLLPVPTTTSTPKAKKHKKAPIAGKGASGSTPSGSSSGSAGGSRGHAGKGGRPPSTPRPGPVETGIVTPPSAQSLICNLVPVFCGGLRLPIPFA